MPNSSFTAREAVLKAFEQLERSTGRTEFDLREIVQYIQERSSTWRDSTLRTHVSAHMCIDAKDHLHADLERVGRGRYRRLGRGQQRPFAARPKAVASSGRPSHRGRRPATELKPSGDQISVRVEAEWMNAGEVTIDDERLAFPPLPAIPGVYRFVFECSSSAQVYIGETDHLERRMRNYRSPGITQPTNIRVNEAMVAHLRDGGSIALDVVTDAALHDGTKPIPLHFTSTHSRRLVENAAIASHDGTLLNR